MMKSISMLLIGVLLGMVGNYAYRTSMTSADMPVAEPFAMPAPGVTATYQPASPAPATPPINAATRALAPAAIGEPLLIPVAGVKPGQLTDTFDQTRGAERRHEALDIVAPRGTPVLAVADGVVAKLFDSKPGGLTIYQFDTSDQFAYYYAHLDRYANGLRDGMALKRGDLIGYVGTTGNAAPGTPHLHFAIFVLGPEKQWWKGTAINPYALLGGTMPR
jgi:murein DD-endopeptidase MepM/ murein hydrolase activator NlpD